MKIPQIIKEEAAKQGLGKMRYIGELDGKQVYREVSEVDKDGFCVPTGLPCLILFKDGKTEFVGGIEALHLLNRLE